MSTAEQTGNRFFTPRNLVIVALAAIVALIIGMVASWAVARLTATKVTATFDSAIGIYEGSNVRVLGVDVGKVTKVQPQGETVKVEMRVNRGVKLPQGVQVAQIIPSIVADRYLQLFPAFDGSQKQATGDITIAAGDAHVPVEIDQIYANLQRLSQSLGKEGSNKNGALSDFIEVAADNLDGNGALLGQSITNLSRAASTLADSRGNIADTVKNLDVFVGALRQNDSAVRQFNTQMSSFNTFLSGEREQLGAALDTLSFALGDVATFLNDNADKLGKAVRDLQPTGQALLDNKESLLEILTVLPLTVSNLINAYDAESGTLAMRLTIPDLQDPLKASCGLLDLKKLMPGNALAQDFSKKMAPFITQCEELAGEINEGVLQPMLPVLPFGIMSNNKLQQAPAPGTDSGNPDPELPGGN